MSNVYDRQNAEQWEFIKKFQKKFDPYGAIFQKKIFNTQFERKFVIRRNIGEICKVEPVSKFNRGMIQFAMDNFVIESKSQEDTISLLESDDYQQTGYDVAFYGIIANYLAQRYS